MGLSPPIKFCLLLSLIHSLSYPDALQSKTMHRAEIGTNPSSRRQHYHLSPCLSHCYSLRIGKSLITSPPQITLPVVALCSLQCTDGSYAATGNHWMAFSCLLSNIFRNLFTLSQSLQGACIHFSRCQRKVRVSSTAMI